MLVGSGTFFSWQLKDLKASLRKSPGKAGETEALELRGKCIVASQNFEKGDLVRKTETAKSEHHLEKDNSSTAGTS
jgi:hypothetical protein